MKSAVSGCPGDEPISDLRNTRTTVCSITINSSNERDTYKKKLCAEKAGAKDKKAEANQYQFVELTALGSGDNWFDDACKLMQQQKSNPAPGVPERKVCDVLLVSGHFAGTAFFGESGNRLEMNDLEKHSCNKDCGSVLGDPAEVFLFGCNTLADKTSKSGDNRQAMTARLRADGLKDEDIEAIVEARFGQMGEENVTRMQRIFAGGGNGGLTPTIYGYTDIGPLGATVQSSVNNYLDKIHSGWNSKPDPVTKKPEKIPGMTYHDWVDFKRTKGVVNEPFLNSLKGFPASETCGTPLDPNDQSPEGRTRRLICALKDDKATMESRLDVLNQMVNSGNDFVRFLPHIQKFFEDKPPPYAKPPCPSPLPPSKNDPNDPAQGCRDQAAFEKFQARLSQNPPPNGPPPSIAEQMQAKLDTDFKNYPSMRFDMANLGYTLGWKNMKPPTRSDFQKQAVKGFLTDKDPLTGKPRPISAVVSRIICKRLQGFLNRAEAKAEGYDSGEYKPNESMDNRALDWGNFDSGDYKIKSEDLDDSLFNTSSGLTVLGCLGPTDPKIQARMAYTATHAKDKPDPNLAAIYAFTGGDPTTSTAASAAKALIRSKPILPEAVVGLINGLGETPKGGNAASYRKIVTDALKTADPPIGDKSDLTIRQAICAAKSKDGLPTVTCPAK